MNTSSYADLLRDLNALYGSGRSKSNRIVPANKIRRPVDFAKSFSAFNKLSAGQRKLQAKIRRDPLVKSHGFDLGKARTQLDGLLGKIPSKHYCLMDLTLRKLGA